MKFEITQSPNSYLILELNKYEKIIIEKGCLIFSDGEYGFKNKIEVKSYKNIISKIFGGKSLTYNVYTANEDYVNGSSLTNPTIPAKMRKIESGQVLIEQYAVVGANSILLPNTHLEKGVVLGAHSLTKGKYEKWKIYVGAPAKFKKNRPRKIIERDGKKLLGKID